MTTLVRFDSLFGLPQRNGIYKPKEFHGRGTRVVNMGELFAFDYLDDQEMKRVELSEREVAMSLLEPGDLLFARRSLVLEGAGRCVLVRASQEPMTFESSLIRVRLRTDVNAKFYFYMFRSAAGRALMASIATRTAVSGITGTNLAALLVPQPPLPIQRRIADILSAYDDLIENNTKRIKILEEMARSLYREWFVNFRFPGHEKVKMVSSALGRVPEGWQVVPARAVADYVNGYAFKPDDWQSVGTPIVKIRELKNGVTTDTPRYSELLSDKFRVRHGDLLFSWSADIAVYVWPHGDAWLNQHIFLVNPLPDYSRAFLYFVLCEAMSAFRALSNGATMKHIKRGALDQVLVPVPPKRLRERFDQRAEPMIRASGVLQRANAVLTRQRDLLLPRLISGEVSVPNSAHG